MLDERDLQAISDLMDRKIQPINARLEKVETSINARLERVETSISEIQESLGEVRDATNYMVEWIERVEKKVDAAV